MRTLLRHLLEATVQITGAERGLAVDANHAVVHALNFEQEVTADAEFWGFVVQAFEQAAQAGQPMLTNNVITDPNLAPTTNTNFSNLRVVLVMPVQNQGYLYIDQPIKRGAFTREQIERLTHVIAQIDPANHNAITQQDIVSLYESVS